MFTYIKQGKVKKTIMEQSATNTVPPTRAKGSHSGKRGPFARASPSRLGESATMSVAGFQRVLAQAKASRLSETTSRSEIHLVA